tara:strand:+ start:1554 stop:2276 length:723 start_codon:yes stop_codon:yes gene_type:complete
MSSCVSMKKRIYIQDSKESDNIVYPIQNVEYKISRQDILYITVKSLSEVSLVIQSQSQSQAGSGEMLFYLNGYSVNKQGEIFLPVIGYVSVLGKTLVEVKKVLQIEVDVFYKDAIIDVKTAGIKINVLGEVNSPGSYIFYQNQVSIFDVLATSGDLTELANKEEVKLLRHSNNTVIVHKLDLTNENLLSSDFYFLQPNDVIYIEPLKIKSWGLGETGWQTFQTLMATISSTFLIINFFKK